jgi:hypothetical protein
MPALKIWKRRPLRGAARYAFAGVKVADIVDGDQPTQDEFVENLHAASISLQEALPWGCFELSTTSIIMSCESSKQWLLGRTVGSRLHTSNVVQCSAE